MHSESTEPAECQDGATCHNLHNAATQPEAAHLITSKS